MMLNKIWRERKAFDAIRLRGWLTLYAVVVAMTASLAGQAMPRANRITQEVSASTVSSVKIAGSVHPLTKRATDLGEVRPEMPMESLTLNIGLSAAQQKELDALLSAQQDPKSARYRQWLTQEQYGAQFGLTDADLAKVTTWLNGRGFTVKEVAPSRNMITFSGTAAQVESAFRTQIHEYELDGTSNISNATEVSVPAALSGVVTYVGGLSGFRPKPHAALKRLTPEFTAYDSGYHSLTPADWATIYSVNAIYDTAAVTGANMHVGIVGQTYFPTTDIDKFRTAALLDAKKLTMFCISSANCKNAKGERVGDILEADLDVEWAGAIAREATVDYIYASAADAQQGVIEALTYAIKSYQVNGEVVPVISMSYGLCEFEVSGSSEKSSLDAALAQAAAQGQTVVNSSGDEGAACSGNLDGVSTVTNGAHVSWPASSPNVTGVGGTEFNGDGTAANPDLGADAYWSYNGSADIVSSALQYIPETSWNDTAYDQSFSPSYTLSSGGGGVSTLYGLPTWQKAPGNFSGTSMRFVPDVAFSASADHDPYMICTQVFPTGTTDPSKTEGSSCVNGFRFSDGSLGNSYIGGTSAAAPSFAGLLTLLVQKYGKLGNINPLLYSLAGDATTYSTVFNDITTGTNKQPCTGTGCAGGFVGYSSTAGYDLVTGLGSINGYALYTAMQPTSPPGSTTTVLSASPNPVALGGTDTLTATVSPSAATGTVTFKVGGTALGTSTLSDGTATIAVNVTTANGFAAGTDAMTATYGGDGASYAASSAAASLTVTMPTYTLSGATSETIAAGASGAVSLTLVSNNYAGSITFATAVTSANGTAADVTASATAVVLTSGATGSSTLTISPNTSAALWAPALSSPAVPSTPWKSGGLVFVAVLIGLPFTQRRVRSNGVSSQSVGSNSSSNSFNACGKNRRKRAIALVLAAFTIAVTGLLISCGGGGKSTTPSTIVAAPRTYLVTVTPTGSGIVTNPAPISVTVTVP